MKGIILGVNLFDYKSEIKNNDLVCIDDEFYNIVKIDPRWNKSEGEPDNKNCYFVKSKINDNLMNYERSEISKASIAIFDSVAWFSDGKKIRLGNITKDDLRNMKFKACLEWDIATNDVDNVLDADLIELEFNGDVIEKEIYNYENPSTLIKYFKLS